MRSRRAHRPPLQRLNPGLSAVILAAAASPAWASAEAGDTFLGLPRVLWYSLNLIVFFGFLVYLLAKPMSRFFSTRREEIANQLAEAKRQREEAERLRAEVSARVGSLQDEIRVLRERLRSEGEREKEALARQGEEEAARLLAQLDQEATRRTNEARTQLAREAAAIAADLALELLQREISPEDRERIFRKTVDRLRADAKGGEA